MIVTYDRQNILIVQAASLMYEIKEGSLPRCTPGLFTTKQKLEE
jgi:hypothetical protein